ncbi:hypothetical protein Pmani_036658 [Petrolisthes manimaculis]|uniref:Uncharacterized protein n=1 Tax=Petrolisthes manimaculis TaxID=1843537 RepID=A0AAE1NIA3_9EUCA|nr:hypothetical protein Pmani_036658 [Petrolisthes manimaculis]
MIVGRDSIAVDTFITSEYPQVSYLGCKPWVDTLFSGDTGCSHLYVQHLKKVDAPVAAAAVVVVVAWMAPGVACVLETGSATSASSITSLHAISASSARPPNDLYFSPPREHLDQDKLEWRRWNTTGYLF